MMIGTVILLFAVAVISSRFLRHMAFLSQSIPCGASPPGHLRVVSMNICMTRFSDMAPSSWTLQDQLDALQRELLDSDPHIIAIQEAPDANFCPFENYVLMGSKPSHMGYTSIMLKRDLAEHASLVETPYNLPVVLIKLQTHPALTSPLYIASVHLTPSKTGQARRRHQVQLLQEAAVSDSKKNNINNNDPLSQQKQPTILFMGDTNMREGLQDAPLANDWKDAWIELGADEATRYTWDTIDHRYSEERNKGLFWNAYYGHTTKPQQQRYDRMYYYPAESSSVLQVDSFSFVAHRPLDSETRLHFLSDHFGIQATFRVKRTVYSSTWISINS